MHERRIRSSSTTSCKGIHNGARLFAVDPRRTSSAEWADLWLGIDVGTDIALSNTMAREIIASDLHDKAFIGTGDQRVRGLSRKRRGLDAGTWRCGHGRPRRGDPGGGPRLRARGPGDDLLDARDHRAPQRRRQRARADQPRPADGPRRHVRKRAQPLRGQNNVQGGGDMGAIPNKLPGFQDIETDAEARERFERAWGVRSPRSTAGT